MNLYLPPADHNIFSSNLCTLWEIQLMSILPLHAVCVSYYLSCVGQARCLDRDCLSFVGQSSYLDRD